MTEPSSNNRLMAHMSTDCSTGRRTRDSAMDIPRRAVRGIGRPGAPETLDRSVGIALENCRRIRDGEPLLHRVV